MDVAVAPSQRFSDHGCTWLRSVVTDRRAGGNTAPSDREPDAAFQVDRYPVRVALRLLQAYADAVPGLARMAPAESAFRQCVVEGSGGIAYLLSVSSPTGDALTVSADLMGALRS